MNYDSKLTYIGPHGHDYSDAFNLIRQYCNYKVVCIPNAGNAGDSLINLGMYHLLSATGVDWEVGSRELSYPGRVIIHSGGGSLIDEYDRAGDFIERNHKICRALIVLPHTIRGHSDLFNSLGENCYIFARENKSYSFLVNNTKSGANILLSHDLAFILDNSTISQTNIDFGFFFQKGIAPYWIRSIFRIIISRIHTNMLSVIRTDSESTEYHSPMSNFDLSNIFSSGHLKNTKHYMSPESCASTAKIIGLIVKIFSIVSTNRLHIAIISAILGRTVVMRDNSYGKNNDVFMRSIKDYFPNVEFVNE